MFIKTPKPLTRIPPTGIQHTPHHLQLLFLPPLLPPLPLPLMVYLLHLLRNPGLFFEFFLQLFEFLVLRDDGVLGVVCVVLWIWVEMRVGRVRLPKRVVPPTVGVRVRSGRGG